MNNKTNSSSRVAVRQSKWLWALLLTIEFIIAVIIIIGIDLYINGSNTSYELSRIRLSPYSEHIINNNTSAGNKASIMLKKMPKLSPSSQSPYEIISSSGSSSLRTDKPAIVEIGGRLSTESRTLLFLLGNTGISESSCTLYYSPTGQLYPDYSQYATLAKLRGEPVADLLSLDTFRFRVTSINYEILNAIVRDILTDSKRSGLLFDCQIQPQLNILSSLPLLESKIRVTVAALSRSQSSVILNVTTQGVPGGYDVSKIYSYPRYPLYGVAIEKLTSLMREVTMASVIRYFSETTTALNPLYSTVTDSLGLNELIIDIPAFSESLQLTGGEDKFMLSISPIAINLASKDFDIGTAINFDSTESLHAGIQMVLDVIGNLLGGDAASTIKKSIDNVFLMAEAASKTKDAIGSFLSKDAASAASDTIMEAKRAIRDAVEELGFQDMASSLLRKIK